jgi:hypothetical protein
MSVTAKRTLSCAYNARASNRFAHTKANAKPIRNDVRIAAVPCLTLKQESIGRSSSGKFF